MINRLNVGYELSESSEFHEWWRETLRQFDYYTIKVPASGHLLFKPELMILGKRHMLLNSVTAFDAISDMECAAMCGHVTAKEARDDIRKIINCGNHEIVFAVIVDGDICIVAGWMTYRRHPDATTPALQLTHIRVHREWQGLRIGHSLVSMLKLNAMPISCAIPEKLERFFICNNFVRRNGKTSAKIAIMDWKP